MDNPFADLVPQQKASNPFADLVPKNGVSANPFASLVPPKVQDAKGNSMSYLSESASQLAQAPKGVWNQFKEGTSDAFNVARDTAAEGVAKMKTLTPTGVLGGAAEAVRGTLGEIAAPVGGAMKVFDEDVAPGLLPEFASEAVAGKRPPTAPKIVTPPELEAVRTQRPTAPPRAPGESGLSPEHWQEVQRTLEHVGDTSEGPMQGPIQGAPLRPEHHEPVRAAMQGVVDDFRKRFGIERPLSVTLEPTGGAKGDLRFKQTGDLATLRKESAGFSAFGRPSKYPGDKTNFRIRVDPNAPAADTFSTLAHEFGHFLHFTKYEELPEVERQEIVSAFRRDTGVGAGLTDKQWTDQWTDFSSKAAVEQRTKATTLAEGQLKSFRSYQHRYEEWFANQVRTFLTSNKEAVGTVDKFFKGIADSWKWLYQRMTGRTAVAPEVEAFMQKYGGFSKDKVDLAPESVGVRERPLSIKAPQPGASYASAGAQASSTADIARMNKAAYEAALPKEPGVKQAAINGVNAIKAVFAPETMRGALKGDVAAASIRKNVGRMAQQEARSAQAMEPYRKLLRDMPLEDQLETLKWLQKPDVAAQRQAQMGYDFRPPPDIADFLQGFKDLMQHWRGELEKRGKTAAMDFKENYVSQMWRDPVAARAKLSELGPKQGSSGFTKKTVFDDYEQGIRAGLVPITTDPVEIAMRYVENVSRYLALNDVLDEGAASANIVWRDPKHAPQGWVKLEGRAGQYKGGMGQEAYAPPGYAAVYNAYVSHNLDAPMGSLLAGAQRVANSTSAFQLGLSAYHATNIATEAMVGGFANAIDELAGGNMLRAGLAAAKTPVRPITNAVRGYQMRNAYLNDVGSPALKKVVQLATDANFRVAGKGRAADEYRFTGSGSFITSFRKGLLKAEAQDALNKIKANPVTGSAKAAVNLAARSLETIAAPLFDYYIPLVKSGAFQEMVETWLRAHPEASEAEQVAFARKASDIIDNRFGEMNQDNIFWQRWMKQTAQASFLSYSYTLGTTGLAGGAAIDAASLPKKGWSPNLSYAIALPIVTAALGATYQYLKTGKAPESLNDLWAPQTGGQSPNGPERARLPSYMNTVFGVFNSPGDEAANKLSPALRGTWQALHNQDWRGDPIAAHSDPALEKVWAYLQFAASQWEPIAAQNKNAPGSKISSVERFMGVQPQGMRSTNPQGFKKMMDKKERNEDALAALHKKNAERAAKGLAPLHGKAAGAFIRSWRPAYRGVLW